MSKLVEVKCPAKISLFLNALGFDEKQDLINFKMLNQTVDLYDIITLKEESNLSGTIVNMNEKILSKDNIYEIACNLFFEYTNIKPKGLYIDIKKIFLII